MIEHRFYLNLGPTPSLLSDGPIWIGASELGHPPLYYILLAVLLRLLRYSDVAFQLYVCRLVSLALYLLSVLLGYKIVSEIVSAGHLLRLAVPGLMVFLPSYTDLMTAVNNDVGAAVMLSLFLWGAVRGVVRGVSPWRLLWMAVATALCVLTKNTAAVAVVLLPLALVLALARHARMWWAAGVACAVGAAAAVALFAWGDALLWYRRTSQDIPTSCLRPDAPWGRRAMAVEVRRGAQVYQPLPPVVLSDLSGKTVTLGAWMWADRPLKARTPLLSVGGSAWRAVDVDTIPRFHVITKTVSADVRWGQVILYPYLGKDSPTGATVYYDGLVLVEGGRLGASPPRLEGRHGQRVVWGAERLVNLVRNASAESTGPRFRPWIDRRLARYGRRPPSQLLTSLFDWRVTWQTHRVTIVNLFNSFWVRFAWNSVGLSAGWMHVATVLSIIGAVGALVGTFRAAVGGGTRRETLIVLGAAAALVWLNAQFRSQPPSPHPFIPSARYTYPAIIPTALALVGGWWSLAPRQVRKWVLTALFAVLGLFDIAALITIWAFWYGR